MPSLSLYKTILGASTTGTAHKNNADIIMEQTWDNDIATRDCYFYDWYHDKNVTILNKLNPIEDENKVMMRIKYLTNSSQTLEKNAISYHLQMKPSQECVVDYYDEYFGNRYGAVYPCGLYVDITDYHGDFNKWLVCSTANYNDAQFPTFELLRCNYVLQYIFDGVKYQVPCVLRSTSSYTTIDSGSVISSVDDRQKIYLPLNRDTEKLYYNQRLLLDNKVLTEPRAWKISKVNRIDMPGIVILSLEQSQFNEHTDYVEIDSATGEVIGLWADYYKSAIAPTDYEEDVPVPSTIYSTITYSGTKAEIKVNGSYKKFTVNFYDGESSAPFESGIWSFTINNIDASDLVEISTEGIDENQIKVKFIGDTINIGKVLTITYTSDTGVVSSVDVEVKAL